MKRDIVDLHLVEDDPATLKMHGRLLNWARAQNSPSSRRVHPMFAKAKTSDQWGYAESSVPVDYADAQRIGRGVVALPEPHRKAIHWYYVKPTSPSKPQREIGVTRDGLDRLVRDGRRMLINRAV